MTAKYPFGIGATVEIVRDLIRKDKEAVRLWDRAVRKAGGAPQGNRNAAKGKTTVDNIHSCSTERPSGTSPEATIRRLEKDAGSGNEKAQTGYSEFPLSAKVLSPIFAQNRSNRLLRVSRSGRTSRASNPRFGFAALTPASRSSRT